MPKCIADCPRFATHVVNRYDPLCQEHAEQRSRKADRQFPDSSIPHCRKCQHELEVIDWNSSRFMYVCRNNNCTLVDSPQGGEYKFGHGPASRLPALHAV